MTGTTKTVRVRISGRVQGVWYRGWTVREAEARNLSGWVRNLGNGDVEAVFSGKAEAVDAMVAACWRGPRAARVLAVTPVSIAEIVALGFRQIADG